MNTRPDKRTVFTRSRLLVLVIAAVAVGTPAVVLRALCVGKACEKPFNTSSQVPFCSLPPDTRALIAAGFREEQPRRSPEVVAVTDRTVVAGGTAFQDEPAPAWPSSVRTLPARVPIVFAGAGVDPEARLPDGTGLDDIAPTISEIIDLRRKHPEVRSGEAVPDVASGETVNLVVLVALKNIGSAELEDDPSAWPRLQELMDEGAGTLDATTGSLPLEPAATLTTIGTGGLPKEHGMIGELVRNDAGSLARTWGRRSPTHIIATLGDDLDEQMRQEAVIGLVRAQISDRGLTGGNWHAQRDKDAIVTDPKTPVASVAKLLQHDFGDDEVPDLLAVALDGAIDDMDEELGKVLVAAQRTTDAVTFVVTASGSTVPPGTEDMTGAEVAESIEAELGAARPVVEAAVPGGLFLDQETLAQAEISDDEVLRALRDLRGPDGDKVFADVFSAIAVSFARYC